MRVENDQTLGVGYVVCRWCFILYAPCSVCNRVQRHFKLFNRSTPGITPVAAGSGQQRLRLVCDLHVSGWSGHGKEQTANSQHKTKHDAQSHKRNIKEHSFLFDRK